MPSFSTTRPCQLQIILRNCSCCFHLREHQLDLLHSVLSPNTRSQKTKNQVQVSVGSDLHLLLLGPLDPMFLRAGYRNCSVLSALETDVTLP